MYQTKEQDWKLFRKKLPIWQEAYMDKLNQEYVRLLSREGLASDKFWELEKKIKSDRKNLGVLIELNKQNMPFDLIRLIHEGVITVDDLDEFSDELKETVNYLIERLG